MNTIDQILINYGCKQSISGNVASYTLDGDEIAYVTSNEFALDMDSPRALYSQVYDAYGTPDFEETVSYHWVL